MNICIIPSKKTTSMSINSKSVMKKRADFNLKKFFLSYISKDTVKTK